MPHLYIYTLILKVTARRLRGGDRRVPPLPLRQLRARLRGHEQRGVAVPRVPAARGGHAAAAGALRGVAKMLLRCY